MPYSSATTSAARPLSSLYSRLKDEQKQLRHYLLQLAATEGLNRIGFWKEHIEGPFLGKPTVDRELELLEQLLHHEDPIRTKALTAFWILKLLTEPHLPPHVDGIIQMIHHGLYRGGQLVSNCFFDSVIISDYDVSNITSTLVKITLLRYLERNLGAIQQFMAQNPEEVQQHYPQLQRLNNEWLNAQAAGFANIVEAPYNHVRYRGAPWSQIPPPAPVAPRVTAKPVKAPKTKAKGAAAKQNNTSTPTAPPTPSLTPWQQLWKAYRDESPQGDFNFLVSFYRTNKFFCSLKKRTKEPVTNATPMVRLFYRIIFWLNVPLILDTVYYQFWVLLKNTLKVSYDYLIGSSNLPAHSLKPLKKWYELTLTVLFAPFILLIPLVAGIISIPFNGVYLLFQYCFPGLANYKEIAKVAKYFLTSIESWIKLRFFMNALKIWSQFLAARMTMPSYLVMITNNMSVAIGIIVALGYMIFQLWHNNFEFQTLIDDTMLTLAKSIINDPLTHLVSISSLVVAPGIALALLAGRVMIGLVNGLYLQNPLEVVTANVQNAAASRIARPTPAPAPIVPQLRRHCSTRKTENEEHNMTLRRSTRRHVR